MDFSKSTVVDEFIQYKNGTINIPFSVKVELRNSRRWTSLGNSNLEIQNNIPKDDYIFIFINGLIGDKPYLGQYKFNMESLGNIKFDGQYLFFTTKEGQTVRLSWGCP